MIFSFKEVSEEQSGEDKHIEFFRDCVIRIIEIPEGEEGIGSNLTEEGLFYFENQKTIRYQDQMFFVAEEGKRYLFQVDFLSDYNFEAGKFQLQFLIKSAEIEIKKLDLTPTTQYLDNFKPNKYGLICRERLFVNDSENLTSLKLKICKFENHKASQQDFNPQKGKGKGKSQPSGGGGGSTSQDKEVEFEDKRLVILEIFEEEELKYKIADYNQVILPNLVLRGDPSSHKNYYLQARFELRNFPECKMENELTEGLHWVLQMTSTNVSVLFPFSHSTL